MDKKTLYRLLLNEEPIGLYPSREDAERGIDAEMTFPLHCNRNEYRIEEWVSA